MSHTQDWAPPLLVTPTPTRALTEPKHNKASSNRVPTANSSRHIPSPLARGSLPGFLTVGKRGEPRDRSSVSAVASDGSGAGEMKVG